MHRPVLPCGGNRTGGEARRPGRSRMRPVRDRRRNESALPGTSGFETKGRAASQEQGTMPRVNRHSAPRRPVIETGGGVLFKTRKMEDVGRSSLPCRLEHELQQRGRGFGRGAGHLPGGFMLRTGAVVILGNLIVLFGRRFSAAGWPIISPGIHPHTAPAHRHRDAQAEDEGCQMAEHAPMNSEVRHRKLPDIPKNFVPILRRPVGRRNQRKLLAKSSAVAFATTLVFWKVDFSPFSTRICS